MNEFYLVAFESANGILFEENLTKEKAEEMYIRLDARSDVLILFICKQLNAKIVSLPTVIYE